MSSKSPQSTVVLATTLAKLQTALTGLKEQADAGADWLTAVAHHEVAEQKECRRRLNDAQARMAQVPAEVKAIARIAFQSSVPVASLTIRDVLEGVAANGSFIVQDGEGMAA